jgi:hypothetical protein
VTLHNLWFRLVDDDFLMKWAFNDNRLRIWLVTGRIVSRRDRDNRFSSWRLRCSTHH